MGDTQKITVTFADKQVEALDNERGLITRAALIREALRHYWRQEYGREFPPDPQVGGPRGKRKKE